MAADFTVYSNHNKNAAFSKVAFGSDALILEAELNEQQDIIGDKLKDFIDNRFGTGFQKTGSTLSYATGTVTYASDIAFVGGDMITISSLTLALAEGETAYLDTYIANIAFGDTIKTYGNQQTGTTITNWLKDSRPNEETTRRKQLQYNLVKTTGVSGHTYTPVCIITGGALIDLRATLVSVAVGTATADTGYNVDLVRCYNENVKNIMDASTDEVWVNTGGAQSADLTNVKVGYQSLKLAETDNTAGYMYTELPITLDLTKFPDGSTSSTSDYICLTFYISDISKVYATSGMRMHLGNTAMTSYFAGGFDASAMVTGWNFKILAKSAFTTGTGMTWDAVQKIRLGWDSVANSLGAYISFQLVQLVRKDPSTSYPNPFQHKENGSYVRDFTVDTLSAYYLGYEFGELITKDLAYKNNYATLLGQKAYTDNFIIRSECKIPTSATYTNRLSYYVNSTNWVTVNLGANVFSMMAMVSGSVVINQDIAFTLGNGATRVVLQIIRKGASFTVSSTSYNANTQLLYVERTFEASLTGNGYLGIGMPPTVSIPIPVKSASITTLANADHANVAEVANSLSQQGEKLLDKGFNLDIARCYNENVKHIADISFDENWTVVAGGAIQTYDTVNTKIGNQSLRITENDATGGFLSSARNSIALDLSTFPDGSASATTDYIRVVFYISDITKVSFSSSLGIRLVFDQATTPLWTNFKLYTIYQDDAGGSLVTGWNCRTIAKSAFSTFGTGAWSGIQSINIGWDSTASATGAYVSIQSIDMVRKDPSASVPNPFQRKENGSYVRDFAINNGFWWLGLESGEVISKDLNSTGTYSTPALLGTKLYSDFVATEIVRCTNTSGKIYSSCWQVSSTNLITTWINGATVYLRSYVSNVAEVSLTGTLECGAGTTGDIFSITLTKRGSSVTLAVLKNGITGKTLTMETSLSGEGYLGQLSSSTYEPAMKSLSITAINHAAHADVSEVANSLSIQGEKLLDKGYSLDMDRLKENYKTISMFQPDETWTASSGTIVVDTYQPTARIGSQIIRLAEPDNTAGTQVMSRTVSLDLTKFTDGSISTTNDYIQAVVYIPDATKVDQTATYGVTFALKSGASKMAVLRLWSGSSPALTTGFNYIYLKKSAMQTYSGWTDADWATVTSVDCAWTSVANAANSYIAFNLIQMIRSDPASTMPNPFQHRESSGYVKDFSIVGSAGQHCWFAGYEYGEPIAKNIASTALTNSIASVKKYGDCIINAAFICNYNNYVSGVQWYQDSSNLLSAFIDGGYFYLRKKELSTEVDTGIVLAGLTVGDIVKFTLKKSGSAVSATVSIFSVTYGVSNYELSTTSTLTGFASLGLEKRASKCSGIKSFSVTSLEHAHSASIADMAKGLVGGNVRRFGVFKPNGSTATYTISGIPTNAHMVKVSFTVSTSNGAVVDLYMQMNGKSAGSYQTIYTQAAGAAETTATINNDTKITFKNGGIVAGGSIECIGEIIINSQMSWAKSMMGHYGYNYQYNTIISGSYGGDTEPLSSITFYITAGAIHQNSTFVVDIIDTRY